MENTSQNLKLTICDFTILQEVDGKLDVFIKVNKN